MLSEQRVRELFYEYLPKVDGLAVGIMTQDRDDFIAHALCHPFVKLQIQAGVYTEDNIYTDFLGPARAHTGLGLQVICMDIFEQILDGIPDDIAEGYVRSVAMHEAHHFHEENEPLSAAEHLQAEMGCASHVLPPDVQAAVHYVEQNSPVYRRVFPRLAQLGKVSP